MEGLFGDLEADAFAVTKKREPTVRRKVDYTPKIDAPLVSHFSSPQHLTVTLLSSLLPLLKARYPTPIQFPEDHL